MPSVVTGLEETLLAVTPIRGMQAAAALLGRDQEPNPGLTPDPQQLHLLRLPSLSNRHRLSQNASFGNVPTGSKGCWVGCSAGLIGCAKKTTGSANRLI